MSQLVVNGDARKVNDGEPCPTVVPLVATDDVRVGLNSLDVLWHIYGTQE